jgi:DNA replicative helicase MCM subunit Mcm2 (Cdc46/Mcm family)
VVDSHIRHHPSGEHFSEKTVRAFVVILKINWHVKSNLSVY